MATEKKIPVMTDDKISQHKRLASGEKITGMAKGGKAEKKKEHKKKK